jgi:hypothetical protein
MAHGMLKILALEDVGLIDRALRKENILIEGSQADTEEASLDAISRFCPDVISSGYCVKYLSKIGFLNPYYFI